MDSPNNGIDWTSLAIRPSSEGGSSNDMHVSRAQERGYSKRKPAVKDHGMTILSEGSQPVADIFLIHGLQGHPEKTFTYFGTPEKNPNIPRKPSTSLKFWSGSSRRLVAPNPAQSSTASPTTSTVFWPYDLLPYDFPRARIITFGYDSAVSHWFSGPVMKLDIFSYGESLLNELDARRRADPERPIIFIVHSLGGLILKEALRRAKTASDPRFKLIYESLKAIVFFGTPHRGGSYVDLGLTVRKLAKCAGFATHDRLLRNLKFDSSVAKLLREEFSKFLDEKRPRIFTFQEGMGFSRFGPLSGKVVEDYSSELDYAHEQKSYIHANHVDMCRFSGRDDGGYQMLKDGLTLCFELTEIDRLGVDDLFANSSRLSRHSPSSPGLRERLLASLHMPETQERFEQVDLAYQDTCNWIFEDANLGFVKWLQTGQGIFWVSGKPGSGKSTLMKYVISDHRTFEHLYMNRPGHQLIWAEFFFSNRGKKNQRTLEGLFHRILYQLLKQSSCLAPMVQATFENCAAAQGVWSLIYLEAAMLEIVKQRKEKINICLFIDALDEQAEDYMQDHRRLVAMMEKLIRHADGKTVNIMLCLSSRPETIFMDSFARWPGIRVHDHTIDDLRLYINGRLKSYLASRPDLASSSLATVSLQKTFDQVFMRAEGVFLWVKLVTTDLIEGLMDGDNPEQIQQRLCSVPGNGDLHQLYHLIILSLKPTYLKDAFVMLQIAYAMREPMPIDEFFSALDYVHGDPNSDTARRSFHETERRLTSRCRGLLEIQTSSWQDEECQSHTGKVVQFLHQSVKDYLSLEKSFEKMQAKLGIDHPINGHVYLLKFLTSKHLRKYSNKPEDLYQLPQFDLRNFAVLYHSRMAEQTLGTVISGPINALAGYVDNNELASVYLRIDGWECPESWNPTFLTLATQAGLLLYVEQEIAKLEGLEKIAGGRPLLHWAVMPMPSGLCTTPNDPFVSMPEMIKLLLRLGANIEEEFEYQESGSRSIRTAFGWTFRQATSRGVISPVNLVMTKTLLSEGANPDVLVYKNMSALQWSIRNADRTLAKLLLHFRARVENLADADWTHFEQTNIPMSIVKAFRDSDLRARDLTIFAEFYAQTDEKQKPKNLLKQYPSGTLEIRQRTYKKTVMEEIYVTDWPFVVANEKGIKRFLRLYQKEDFIGHNIPKPISECHMDTKRRTLVDWATPSDAIEYWS